MAALSLTYCRLRTGVERVARVLCSVHRLDRYTSSSKPCRRYQASSSERIFDNRYLQANSTAHEHSDKFHLQHIRWSTRLKSEYREVWTENLILTLKKCLNQELKTTSYENILAAVIDLKSKVEDNKITFKLSAELGRELLEMITHTRHLSTVQKSTLTGLVWQILNLIQDFKFDESHYTSYVMACSESHLQINIPELRQKMTDSGFLFGKSFLQAVLSYHCAMEELNQGCEILKEMKDSDMTVDGRCFKHLVTAYAKTRSVSAKDMLDIMREYNIKQDIDTFTALIHFHATRGDMDAIDKTFEQIENEDPISAEDKTIITLQIILPLLQYKFQKQASKTINSIGVIRHPPFRLNAAVHKCANSLLMSGYVDEAFLVFCLPFKRGRSFIQCFHNSEASKKADGIVRGVELSVRLLTESRVDLRKLFMDSSSASLAFLTRLMKELKQLNYVKDSEELKKSALDNVHQSPWKNLVVVLADMDLPTLKAKADEELKRHVHDPHYGTHTDCVNRILEKTVYQEEAEALDLYRNLLAEESDDPRLPAVKSLGAAYVHTMYLKLGNYPQSLHYIKEMICLSPKYIGNLAKVVSNATVMLKNGYKEGVMESIDFCLQHMDKTSGTIILPKVLPEVLMQLLPPSQAFACLQRFRVHISQSDDHLLKAGLMKSYMMGKDVDLLATAYIAYLNYNRRRDYQICVDVIVQLIKEDREDLVQKVLEMMTSLMGQPLTSLCYTISLLHTDNRGAVKKLQLKNPTFLKVVMARNSIVIQRLLLNLFRKPKLIDTLLDTLVKSDDIDAMVSFENNLSEAIQNCNRMRKAELLSTLLEFSSQNPDTSLGKCMESITDKLPQLRMYMQ